MQSIRISESVEQWIEANVATVYGNPDVVALRSLAHQHDSLDEDSMSKKQMADTIRALIKAIEAKQVKILNDLDVAATAGIRQWGQTAGVWLGMIPISLLSDKLRDEVVGYLERIHGIRREVYEYSDRNV